MYLSCRKLCFSIVWTTKDVAVMKIERDDSWSANIPHLIFIVVIFLQNCGRRFVNDFIINLPCDCI